MFAFDATSNPDASELKITELTSPLIPRCFEMYSNAEDPLPVWARVGVASLRKGERLSQHKELPAQCPGQKKQPEINRVGLSLTCGVLTDEVLSYIVYFLNSYQHWNLEEFLKLLKNWKMKQHWTPILASSHGLELNSPFRWTVSLNRYAFPALYCFPVCHLLDSWGHWRLHSPWLGGREARRHQKTKLICIGFCLYPTCGREFV